MSKNQSFKEYQLGSSQKVRQRSSIQLKKDFKAGSANDEEFYDRRTYYDSVTGESYYPWMFSKTLDHDSTTGFPRASDVEKVVKAVKEGGESLDDIPKHEDSVRKLEGVASANSFNLVGTDSSVPRVDYKPIDSEGSVFEMAEVYAKSIKRDTSFWDIEQLASDDVCVATLNNFSDKTTAPTVGGQVTGKTLFRGAGQDETVGPYVSQFLYLPFNYGNIKVDQQYEIENDSEASVTKQGWLDIQQGVQGTVNAKTGEELYCHSGRVLGSKVHNDPLYQFYYNAGLISFQNGISPAGFSHEKTSEWTSSGGPDVLASVAHVALGALRVAWYQKWCVAMRVRPEVYAQRIQLAYESTEEFVKQVQGLKNVKDICDAKCGDLLQQVMNANGSPVIPALTSDTSHAGYTITTSSNHSDTSLYNPYQSFDNDIEKIWCSTSGLYIKDGVVGKYGGSEQTTVEGVGSVAGEWLQMEFTTPVQNVSKVSIWNSQVVSAQPLKAGTIVYDNGDGIWRFFAEIGHHTEVRKYEYCVDTPVTMKSVRAIIKEETNQTGCFSNIQIYTSGDRYLKLQFSEGSPTHPATPAGHSTVAGACCTVLKAMLETHDENGLKKVWSPDVVHSLTGSSLDSYTGDTSGMSIVGELNKLASNVSIGRNISGVHYRCDGDCGIDLGEQYAITYLVDKCREYSESYNEVFEGFTLEKFDGTTVKITHLGVESV